MEYVLHRLGRPASETIVIGDSTSDILAGNQAGCKTVLLLGGATPADALVGLTEDRAPWLVIHELTDLL
jgi:phosphoglycolate phosphatase-like HAD superfamily hydrolase